MTRPTPFRLSSPTIRLTVADATSSRAAGSFTVIAPSNSRYASSDRCHNVLANPEVTVELGEKRFTARAAPLEGEERDRMYARQAALNPAFPAYQERTHRVIPVIALYPESERLRAFGDELIKIHDYFRDELSRLRTGEVPADELEAHFAYEEERLVPVLNTLTSVPWA
ncbi:nitroreductase/quinone reductase family protein [Nonomuraea basaltis]|uniref:nitroreductase/quinone reductase family protein n=1 Tax=Nonomuraea basaltis TaxID=2495887 RepID=UPI00110C4B46|nr:nitroreductase/quinone reductase family protein [Nonomuraea basaltis]TMR96516.1 nitroreductase family deazaflavin-dependent oxidoreductase [Nonomuraea basaltis]